MGLPHLGQGAPGVLFDTFEQAGHLILNLLFMVVPPFLNPFLV
jgi:hypothetical protein